MITALLHRASDRQERLLVDGAGALDTVFVRGGSEIVVVLGGVCVVCCLLRVGAWLLYVFFVFGELGNGLLDPLTVPLIRILLTHTKFHPNNPLLQPFGAQKPALPALVLTRFLLIDS